MRKPWHHHVKLHGPPVAVAVFVTAVVTFSVVVWGALPGNFLNHNAVNITGVDVSTTGDCSNSVHIWHWPPDVDLSTYVVGPNSTIVEGIQFSQHGEYFIQVGKTFIYYNYDMPTCQVTGVHLFNARFTITNVSTSFPLTVTHGTDASIYLRILTSPAYTGRLGISLDTTSLGCQGDASCE